MSIEHATLFREGLVRNELSKSPDTILRNAVHGWNLAVKRIPCWPRQTLALPSQSKRVKLPLDSFPDGFAADLAGFVSRLENPDPLDPEALSAPLRRSTIELYSRCLLRFASSLVHAGVPIEEIDSLAALVAPDKAERGLRCMLSTTCNRTTPQIAQVSGLLKMAARRYVKVSPEDQKKLDSLALRLAQRKQPGMTEKNRERLRPLQDPATLRRLLLLPEKLFKDAEARTTPRAAALAREDALLIGILLTCPIRRQNLTEIHLERNSHRPGDGRVFLVFPADEVKNARPIEFELPPYLVEMIDHHLATRSPSLCVAASPWLFSRRKGGGPLDADGLAKRIKKTILREAGLIVNPHLFRHFAAKFYLDRHPGAYEAVRHLLGHKATSTTLNAYVGFEAGTAARLFAEVTAEARRA